MEITGPQAPAGGWKTLGAELEARVSTPRRGTGVPSKEPAWRALWAGVHTLEAMLSVGRAPRSKAQAVAERARDTASARRLVRPLPLERSREEHLRLCERLLEKIAETKALLKGQLRKADRERAMQALHRHEEALQVCLREERLRTRSTLDVRALLQELLTVSRLDEARGRLDLKDPLQALVEAQRAHRSQHDEARTEVLASWKAQEGRADIKRRRRDAACGLPEGDQTALFAEELEQVADFLDTTIARIRAVRSEPLFLRGHEARAHDVIASWNDFVIEQKFRTLPTLCLQCGIVVLLKRGAHGPGAKLSVMCSERCRTNSKSRRKGLAKRERGDK